MMRELEKLLPEHKAGLTLNHNPHKGHYKPVEQWIGEEETLDWFEWVSDEQRQKAIETDSVWTLQWYPETAVGFYALAAADLEPLLEAATSAGEERPPIAW